MGRILTQSVALRQGLFRPALYFLLRRRIVRAVDKWVEALPGRVEAAGISPNELAALTGLDVSAIHRLLKGDTKSPQVSTRRKIDAALDGVTVPADAVMTLREEVAELRATVQQLQQANQQQLASLQLVQSMLQHLLEAEQGRTPRR